VVHQPNQSGSPAEPIIYTLYITFKNIKGRMVGCGTFAGGMAICPGSVSERFECSVLWGGNAAAVR
jgi:hypothetical protein